MPYVTIITHYTKSLGNLSPRYKKVPFAITYNLVLITKMGYRDHDNDGIFVKVRGVIDDDDDDGDKQAPVAQSPQAQAPQA